MDDKTEQPSPERLTENYRRGIERLHEALKAAPKLLEHYLLNEMFQEIFPFNEPTPIEHYMKLICRFGLLRLVLAAQCNADTALPDSTTLAKTVQVYCRRFQHNAAFARQVNHALNHSGWNKLDNLYRLLRA